MAATDTTVAPPEQTSQRPVPELVAHRVTRPRTGWRDWVTTVDHKKIGIMYMVTAFVFFMIGGVEALLLRLQLGVADNSLLTPEVYNGLMTMHGTTMIFLFVVPMVTGFANYFVPLQIGARDMAFPRLNMLSYWLFLFAGIIFYVSLFFDPPQAAWTFYTPLSSEAFSPSGGVDAWIFLVHLTGLSSVLGSINFYATIANMRAPGMGWARLPLFCWTVLVFAFLLILVIPVLAGAVTMLLADRHFGTGFFNPAEGGNTLLWQHLFWFFGHPEVYIMILPTFGVISEVLPVFARKPIFGYKAVAASTAAIGLLSALVWAHHMFTTPSTLVVLIFFMVASYLIAIPTGIKVFNWVATLWRGSIVGHTPLYFAVGFLTLFVVGGITGIILATFPVDWQLHDSYFVVAHFHYVLVGASMFGIFAGIYYWFPKITGKRMSETLGKVSFWIMFVGFNVTFLIQHSAGLSGMPRRIYEYSAATGFEDYNLVSTIGSFILGLGILLSVINIVRSLKVGTKAGPDPWRGNTLEWFTPSPPPANNFDVVPRVRSVEPMKDIRRQVARSSGRVGVEERERLGI